MKSTCALLAALFVFSVSALQNAPAQAAARTDVYHVHFAKAALGKGAEEAEALKQQAPDAPMRHADIRTTMNIYGDVVTDEMAQAASKVAGLALNGRKTAGSVT